MREKFVNFCLFIDHLSQNRYKFEKFLENLELSIYHMTDKDPYRMVVLGNTNTEGSKIDISIASFGFNQIINEPTHILNNSSSCIGLIFTSQTNLEIESGAHSSLHANCHHQITYVKFSLNVIYPPPYEREVSHYKLVNSDCI